jgi:SAM-dependent methyltransferase
MGLECNICQGATIALLIKERMLGIGEMFWYRKCCDCGHTHICNIPVDMDKYYDSKEYYSFNEKNSFANNRTNGVIKLFSRSAALKAFLSLKNISREAKILDYGCGAGKFVRELVNIGFANARGYDSFLPNRVLENGVLYLSDDINSFKNEVWGIVTLNHVFEHLYNPIKTLQEIHLMLPVGGKLILRIPVIDSYAFEKYREKWVQFDAPRHINLFTRKSIKLAIELAGGYKVISQYDDSFHFQFTGSNLYVKKLTLNHKDNNFKKRLFSLSAYWYHFLAKYLNKKNKGDQIVMVLEKI